MGGNWREKGRPFSCPTNFLRAFYSRVFLTIWKPGLTLSKMRCANSYQLKQARKNYFIEWFCSVVPTFLVFWSNCRGVSIRQVICWKLMRTQLLKVVKFHRHLYGGGHELALHHTNVWKFSQLCGAYLHSLKTYHFQISGALFSVACVQTITKLWLVPSAKQRRDPCSGPPTDSTNYRKCVSNSPSTWLAIMTNKTKAFFNWPIVARTQIWVHSWKSRTRISALFRRRSSPEFNFVCAQARHSVVLIVWCSAFHRSNLFPHFF